MTYLVTVTRQLADILHVVVAYLRQVNHDVRLRTDVDRAAQRPLAWLKVFATFHVVEGSDLHVTKEWYHFQILVKVSHYFITTVTPTVLLNIYFIPNKVGPYLS